MRTRFLMTLILTTIFVAGVFGLSPEPDKDKKGWIPLFNGKDLTGWHLRDPQGPNGWKVVDGVYINTPPSTDIQTDAEYYDFQLHVEFNVNPVRGNSGVYLRDKYEIQIFDSYGKPPSDSGCGALYRRVAPSVNASKPAGEWQTFDITFIGRRLTLVHNDQKVLDNIDVGPMGTGAAGKRPDAPGPLRLQGDHDVIAFRNVRIRPLSKAEAGRIQKEMDAQSSKSKT